MVPYIESIATPEESDDEEPPIVPMENQPRPNQVLHEDTTYHWQPYVCTMVGFCEFTKVVYSLIIFPHLCVLTCCVPLYVDMGR